MYLALYRQQYYLESLDVRDRVGAILVRRGEVSQRQQAKLHGQAIGNSAQGSNC
jgi:hypothetical protein